MRQIALLFLFIVNSYGLFAQTNLTLEGSTVNSAITGAWDGVNISRNQPTTFIYRNNSVTSVNTSGYMLQAGDETPAGSNNNLDGEIITGNKFIWNGTEDPTSITHGVFTGYNINAVLKYNYVYRAPMGLIRKSNGMTNTAGGVAYNIVNNSIAVAAVAKGIRNVNFYNNTFYSSQIMYTGSAGTWRGLVDVYSNTDNGLNAPSTGTKIKNNIFYTKNQIYNIYIYDAACLSGFESDYNLYYCEAGTPVFNYLGTPKTFTQWQALGYDLHSVIINPNFKDFTDYIPKARLDYGTDLGSSWQKGLSVDAVWGITDPATSNQNGTWQVGARIYSSQVIPVTNISVTGASGITTISADKGTLQLNASVLPENATDKSLTWSVVNGSGQATITQAGIVTAIDNGTITAKATANDGSGISGTLLINISNQIVKISSISVSGTGGVSTITVNKGVLQLNSTILPANASNKVLTWSLANGTGQATISTTGLVTAIDNGTVTASATATDGSGVSGSLVITISRQIIPVTGITIAGAGGLNSIAADDGSLQLIETVLPVNASDKSVSWSVVNGTGQASISVTGVMTAIADGTVTARATANDGTGIFGTIVITISNQLVKVTGITVTGSGGLAAITSDKGSLQLTETVLPADATNKTVTWSLINGTDIASISASGLVSAVDNGTVTARALANDGSGIYGTMVITISNQSVAVSGITVTGTGGINYINTDDGTLQLNAIVSPINATIKSVTWSLVTGTGEASLNSTGLLTAVNNGTVTARATANDGTGVSGSLIINISNQVIPVTGITISGAGGATSITADNGTLQLSVTILPLNATNKGVTWSLVNGTGKGTISSTGLVTAIDNGTVTAWATANDGSGIFASINITISNQITPVSVISVSGTGGATIIPSENGSLQLIAQVLPVNATIKSLSWSIVNGTGQATINSSGLVTAVMNGTVTATATAMDGSGIFGSLLITISTGMIPVESINVTGQGALTSISTDNGTLQLSAAVYPVNATQKAVIWSIVNGTGLASINASGLVTAISDGSITAKATALDGSGVYGTLVINISNQMVPVASITVTGSGGASTISIDNGTLQLSAVILPADATNKTVTWSIINDNGAASINSTGLLTAIKNGTVTVRATANDGSDVYGTILVSISSQILPVSGITVTGEGGISAITTDKGALQINAVVLPADATDKTVTWSVVNGTGQATISNTGLLTAVRNGNVSAIASANDGSGVTGSVIITISNQIVLVTGVTISAQGGLTTITSDNGTIQLQETVLPSNATDKSVTWSIVNGNSLAAINNSGLVTAADNGIVTAKATANDGSGVYGTITINISNQVVPVNGISVLGAGGSVAIANDNGSLQLTAEVMPVNATVKSVTWSLVNGTGQAIINTNGRVTAIDNGTVTARATANDGSGIFGTLIITISNQLIPVTSVSVTAPGGITSITTDNGTLQLNALILPSNATNKTLTWTVVNGTGKAMISSTGLVTAVDNGTITAVAAANDGSGIYGNIGLTLSNQIVTLTSLVVTGSGGASIITADGGSLQLSAEALPSNATNKSVTWSIVNGTGKATITSAGLVTAIDNGTVTAIAMANDNSGLTASLIITIFNQVIPVTGIIVKGTGGLTTITSNYGSLQLNATVSPANATDKSVNWTIVNSTGRASIDASGLVTALNNGTVTVIAAANDGSGTIGTMLITISNQAGPVTSIAVSGSGGSTSITVDDGSLQLVAAVLPANATVNTVSWSFINGTGIASINSAGLLTAVDNGTVTVKATAKDGSGVYGTLVITISNQLVPVKVIIVTGAGNSNTITTDNGSLQLNTTITPLNAKDKSVTWSIAEGSDHAKINSSGLVSAINNGIISAKATANDGTGVFGTYAISISNQIVAVSSITITAAGGNNIINADNGTLQLSASVLPSDAKDKSVNWSIIPGTGQADINATGLVTAVENGTVTALATANDGSGVYGALDIAISNQKIQVTGISINGENGQTSIGSDQGFLRVIATVSPANATDNTVTWSIINGTGEATVNSAGLVTAIENGDVTVMATANDASAVHGTLVISITGHNISVTGIAISGVNGETTINNNNKKFQLSATVFPDNATDKTVTWSLVDGSEAATINNTGLVTPIDKGIVTARATATDGTGIFGTMDIPVIIDNADLISIIVTRDEMRIQLNDNYISWKLSLYNYFGSLIYTKVVDSDLTVIDISSVPSGMYIVSLSKGIFLKVAKTIKP